jgi:hypothetical protein
MSVPRLLELKGWRVSCICSEVEENGRGYTNVDNDQATVSRLRRHDYSYSLTKLQKLFSPFGGITHLA